MTFDHDFWYFILLFSSLLKKRGKRKGEWSSKKSYLFVPSSGSLKKIEQKGMTFYHDFCYSFSFSSSLFFYQGREKGKGMAKVVVKSHAFLPDLWKRTHQKMRCSLKGQFISFIHNTSDNMIHELWWYNAITVHKIFFFSIIWQKIF